MIQPSGSNFNIRGLTPSSAVSRAQVAPPVEDLSEAALEEFLSSWASGTPGSDRMSLDQMLTIQAANPEVPQLPKEEKVTNSSDHALRQIEMLVSQNRTIFQNNTAPRSMTDGWNIAGHR